MARFGLMKLTLSVIARNWVWVLILLSSRLFLIHSMILMKSYNILESSMPHSSKHTRCYSLSGEEVGKCNFDTRLICIEKEIVNARHDAMREGLLDKSKEPFSIRLKPFWDISQVGWSSSLFSCLLSNKDKWRPTSAPRLIKILWMNVFQ